MFVCECSHIRTLYPILDIAKTGDKKPEEGEHAVVFYSDDILFIMSLYRQ